MSVHSEKQDSGQDLPTTVVLVNENETSKKAPPKEGDAANEPCCQRCFRRSYLWAVGLGCFVLALIAGVALGYAVWSQAGDDGQYRGRSLF